MGNGGLKSFSGTLSYVAERFPYRRAISVRGGEELIYADLHHSVEKLASGLHTFGVQPGDVVPIVFPDTVESVVSLLAVMRIRAVAAPLLDQVCTEEGFERYLHKYKAKLLLDGPKPNPTARAVANRLDATHWVVSLHDLSDYAAEVGAVAGVINKPDDVAFLLPTDSEVEQKVTQGRLATLVKSVDRQPPLAAADPLLQRLRRHRHLTSMFLRLADAVKSLTTAGGEVAESGNLTKMFSLHDLSDYAADVGAVAGVINEPGDLALLLPTDGDVEQEVTQGRLASLVKSVDRQPSLVAADPLLQHLRHLTSMFLSLADAVKSLTTAGGEVAESGNLTKMFEYGMKLSELSLALAVPVLINLVVNYLTVEQWSKTLAAFLVYMAVPLSLAGLAFNQKLNSCGRWLGATGLTLGMAGVAALVLPAFGWWKGMVAGAVTLVAAVASWVLLVWGAPPGQGVHPGHQGATGTVAPPEQEREPRPSPTWYLPAWFARTKSTGERCEMVGVICDSPTKTTPPTVKEP